MTKSKQSKHGKPGRADGVIADDDLAPDQTANTQRRARGLGAISGGDGELTSTGLDQAQVARQQAQNVHQARPDAPAGAVSVHPGRQLGPEGDGLGNKDATLRQTGHPTTGAGLPSTPAFVSAGGTQTDPEPIVANIMGIDAARALPEVVDGEKFAEAKKYMPGTVKRFKDSDGRTMYVVSVTGGLAKAPLPDETKRGQTYPAKKV